MFALEPWGTTVTASAKQSSSTTRNRAATVDRLALIRAKAEERNARKAEHEEIRARLDAKAKAEDAAALADCHTILDRMERRGNESRARQAASQVPQSSRRRKAIRLAPITGRDADVEEGKGTFRDPYDASTFVTTTVNRRVDVLAAERSAGRITEAQFQVGRMLQSLWEKQLGVRTSGGAWESTTTPRSLGPGITSVGFTIEDIRMLGRIETARAVKAMNERSARVIGDSGVRFLRSILAEGFSFSSYAEARGRGTSERASSDIAKRFRWLLDELTEAQHTAHGPAAKVPNDEYSERARELGQ